MATPTIEAVKAYSTRHGLGALLQGLDISELLTVSSPNCSDFSSDVVDPDHQCEECASTLAASCAGAIAAQRLSSLRPAGEECLLGDRTAIATASPASPSASNAFSGQVEASAAAATAVSEVCAALARHYSQLASGIECAPLICGQSTLEDLALDPGTVRRGVALSFSVVKTWVTVAAPFWREQLPSMASSIDGPTPAASMTTSSVTTDAISVADEFLTALFSPVDAEAAPTGAQSLAMDIALLFARGHLTDLPAAVWGKYLALASTAARLPLMEQNSATSSPALGALPRETLAVRCFITVLCDRAVSPILTEARSRLRGEAGDTWSARSTNGVPRCVVDQVVGKAKRVLPLFESDPDASESHLWRVALIYSDAFFLYHLKPYPTLLATFFLTGRR